MKISIYKYLISTVCLIIGLTSYATTYASLSPVPTEIIYALNAEKNLVGVSTTCNFPEETKEKPILNINHRFGGPHPLHFEDIYYNYRMELLNNIITQNNKEELIKEKYNTKYNKFISTIKAKKHQSEYDCRSAQRVD